MLTIIGLIFSFIYTYASNRNNRKLNELKVISEIYKQIIYLLSVPINYRKKDLYTNENSIVEAIVRRQINDFDNEVDTYWSYFNKTYPELNDIPIEERQDILREANDEYERVMDENLSFDGVIISPAFYCDNEDVCNFLRKVVDHLAINSYIFSKPLSNKIIEMNNVDPLQVMEKYKAQIQYDPNYFDVNPVLFDDPYRDVFILIRRRHEWLLMSKYQRLKENYRESIYRMRRFLRK